ncbi:cytochrome P450 2G1-like [Pleurodeles waltl]|uniref:cytochrome P450 2G1-like n=1 Tax=Pleurodeles waltl TaxID=8319 RepID=UPI0037097937
MLSLSAVFLALVVCVLAAQYLKLQGWRRRYPPGPTPLPIIGNLWTVRFNLQQETLMQLGKTYGNMFTLWMGQTPLIVLNGCHAVRDALISHSEELYDRPPSPLLEAFLKGKGIFTTPEHTWKPLKRLGLTILRILGLGKRSFQERIQEEVQWLTEAFAMTKGRAMDPCVAITNSVTNVIALVIFGHRYSCDDKEFLQLTKINTFLVAFLFSMSARVNGHQKKGIWHAIDKQEWTLGVQNRQSTHCREWWEDTGPV